MGNKIRIVSFDVPSPPDYGGVIDVYYLIKSLATLGVEVELHCFQYNDRKVSEKLKSYCSTITTYARKKNLSALLSSSPFIVESRKHDDLLKNLKEGSGPVLFEGLHCCAYLLNKALKSEKKIVRIHNIEHDYYNFLASAEAGFFKRLFFKREAVKLKRFEDRLKSADLLLSIASADELRYKAYGELVKIPPFHANTDLNLRRRGDYVLYHANLSVAENHKVAMKILDLAKKGMNHKLIIAGRKPSVELRQKAKPINNVEILEDLSKSEMEALVQEAHIHLLPSLSSSGAKLKLINALYSGAHVLCNSAMLAGTEFSTLCELEDDWAKFSSKIDSLWGNDLDGDGLSKRKQLLDKEYNNLENAKRLMAAIENLD